MISICERCKRLILGMELDKCDDCQKWICPDCMATKKGPVYPRLCQNCEPWYDPKDWQYL